MLGEVNFVCWYKQRCCSMHVHTVTVKLCLVIKYLVSVLSHVHLLLASGVRPVVRADCPAHIWCRDVKTVF